MFEFQQDFRHENCSFEDFVAYRLNVGSKSTPPSKLVKLSETEYSKILDVKLRLPEYFINLLGLKNITVEERITIFPDKYCSKIILPPEISKYLDFKEEFICQNYDIYLILTLKIWGQNKLPYGLQSMGQDAYVAERVNRITHEIMATSEIKDSIYDDDIIQ